MVTELASRDESVRETVVQIQESKATTGKYGAQWELKVRWPWTNADSKYYDTVWVEQSDVPRQPPPGLYNVKVDHRALTQKKGGTHDGFQDWMWHWSILQFLSKAEAMPTQTPATSGESPQTSSQSHDDRFRTKEELRWTEAYHMASRVVGPSLPDEDVTPHLVSMADWFYNELAAVNDPASIKGDGPYLSREPEMPPPVADAGPDDELPF